MFENTYSASISFFSTEYSSSSSNCGGGKAKIYDISWTALFFMIGGLESHLSGWFRFFVTKFWELQGTYECYSVTPWL